MSNENEKLKMLSLTGTSILSMMAVAAARPHNVQITVNAFEAFDPMAECAKRIISLNGLQENISVINSRSDSCSSLEPNHTLLITELFDSELIGEGALLAYRHALQNFMAPGCLAVPSAARIMVQLAQSRDLGKFHKLLQTNDQLGFSLPDSCTECFGSTELHDLQLSYLMQKDNGDLKTITKPGVAFEFNFTKLETLKLKESRELHLEREVKSCHELIDGHYVLLFWWELIMDQKGEIVISTKPDGHSMKWREHWIPIVYHLPPKAQASDLSYGPTIKIVASHDEFSFVFGWNHDSPSECNCGLHSRISRNRLYQLNDHQRLRNYQPLIEKFKTGPILYIGDFSFLPLYVSRITKGFGGLVYFSSQKELYSCFIEESDFKNFIHLKEVADLPDVVLVISEPYFTSDVPPHDFCFFWFACLKIPKLLTLEDERMCPNRVVMQCHVIQTDHLWKIRSKLGKKVAGFDLTPFDELIQRAIESNDSKIECHPLWQYSAKFLTNETISVFDWNWRDFKANSNVTKACGSLHLKIRQANTSINNFSFCFSTQFKYFDHCLMSTGPLTAPQAGHAAVWDKKWKQGISFHEVDWACIDRDHRIRIEYEFQYESQQLTINRLVIS